jgi:hypothetical protein
LSLRSLLVSIIFSSSSWFHAVVQKSLLCINSWNEFHFPSFSGRFTYYWTLLHFVEAVCVKK